MGNQRQDGQRSGKTQEGGPKGSGQPQGGKGGDTGFPDQRPDLPDIEDYRNDLPDGARPDEQQDEMTRKGQRGITQEDLNQEAAKSEPQDDMKRKAGQQAGRPGRPEY
jgi:hypothetical protein